MDAGTIIQWAGSLGIIGLLQTVLTVTSGRRKAKTDATAVLTSSAISLSESMREQLTEMEEDLKEVKQSLKEAQEDVVKMRIAMRRLLNELANYRELTEGELQIVDGY